MRDNRRIGDVASFVAADDFYVDANRRVYRVIVDLFLGTKTADPVTIANALRDSGEIDDVRVGYLVDLWDSSPSPAASLDYARIVKTMSGRRMLQHLATDIERDVNGGADIAEIVAEAERRLFAIAMGKDKINTVAVPEVIVEAVECLDEQTSGHWEGGMPTGWVDLDDITGGLQNSEVIVIAARPSVGKTSFGLGLFYNLVIQKGIPGTFFSLEMNRLELAERVLCNHANVPSGRMRKRLLGGKVSDDLLSARNFLSKLPPTSFICDTPHMDMVKIISESRRLKMRHGVRFIVIDYLQLITGAGRSANRQEEVADISRRLKLLARELAIPVVVMAQLNRQADEQRPKLRDLRESGAIEQDADTVLLLHDPNKGKEEFENRQTSEIELIVGKQRNGATGTVRLLFEKEYMRFQNFAMV